MSGLLAFLFSWVHRIISLLPEAISSRVYGTLFGLRLGLGLPVSGPIYEREVTLTASCIPASVFATHHKRPKHVRTMVVIHGMSWTGHKDPRIVNLAQALAAASPSHLVVVPYIQQLAVIDLANDPIGAIREAIEAVVNDIELCPTGQVSIASACISAGFCIIAAADMTKINNNEGTSNKHNNFVKGNEKEKQQIPVDSMFLVGPHADVRNVLQHAVDRKGLGDCRYGLYAVYSSFLQPKGNGLSQLLAAYCVDDHMVNLGEESNRVEPLLKEFPEAAMEYQRFRNDGEYACECIMEMYRCNRKEIDYMSSLSRLGEVDVKYVTLVHSKVDEIVPPSESVILQNAWKKNRDMKLSCIITSLLNHGDQEQITLRHIPEIIRMIDCFSTFFRDVRRRTDTSLTPSVCSSSSSSSSSATPLLSSSSSSAATAVVKKGS